jgi:5-oxoprolinase (ATP-hydrolysing)
MSSGKWRFFIDRGGTFTDVVRQAPDGSISALKLLSDNSAYDDAALEGIRRSLGLPGNAPLPEARIGEIRMGTTVATNALLERKGEPTILLTTKGFADQLRIAYQNRPKLFALRIALPDMLYAAVFEADERMDAAGDILRPLDEDALRISLAAARAKGFKACAIVFMHGYRNPAHEKRAALIARELGFSQISASHQTVPLPRFVSRGDTTVADAYLSPPLNRYVSRIAGALGPESRLLFMTSNGGLAAPGFFHGRDAILSGPAGGVVGMAETGMEAGFKRTIGFDMGGTSTDVSRFDGTYERSYESEIAGVRLRIPMMAVHSVAAGGGSILHFDGARFRVGPDSAGANPGPMSYRRGGALCVTDANVMTGKLNPQLFPKIFGSEGNAFLDADSVRRTFEELAIKIGGKRTPEDVADGFLRIAIDNMALAIKRISVARGYDVRRYALNCFGGAAGQHACLVADALGISRIFFHPFSGVLSAYGMKLARVRTIRQQAIGKELNDQLLEEILNAVRSASVDAESALKAQGAIDAMAVVKVHLRYARSDTTIGVPFGSIEEMRHSFEKAHAERFGFGFEQKTLIAESFEVEASESCEAPGGEQLRLAQERENLPIEATQFYSGGAWHCAPVRRSADLMKGEALEGPALLIEPQQTIVVEPGWRAMMTEKNALVLMRETSQSETGQTAQKQSATEIDPVLLEVFANLFMSIAEEMGATLQNTASSVNIKERLDFSCALFDANAALVANAPHMPVHLGSMGECVSAVLAKHDATMEAGDTYVINAPYGGGTHLPDVTVVAPIFIGGRRRFFVAARGHHADIGGIAPGSMPPFSRDIAEEGVMFDGIRMVRGGRFENEAVRSVLESSAFPARNPEQNIADLKAQAAACARGEAELNRAVELYGLKTVSAYMRHVQDNAEGAVRAAIGALSDGSFEVPMDGGIIIRVQVCVDRTTRSARVDFTGTSAQTNNNLNAPASVTKAAVLYVFRCLVDSDIPMNAGCLKSIEIVLPEGSILNPNPPAAVAGGNVETSQAVVDALFGALNVTAASQGTMNNLTFGDANHQYYETIGGGSGAGPDFDGVAAIQTHMTNSRLTDPEILEARYPVLVEEFSIRKGSGGQGAHKGGDGAKRRIRFLSDMQVGILSTRRETDPFGLNGGKAGARGLNTLIRADGERLSMQGRDEAEVKAGDAIEIETPGGGGYGKAEN